MNKKIKNNASNFGTTCRNIVRRERTRSNPTQAHPWSRCGLSVLLLCMLASGSAWSDPVTRHVWQSSPNPGDGHTTWDTAAHHIQDAVNAAADNDTVLVRPGNYTVPTNAVHLAEAGYEIGTNVVFINKPLVLRSTDGAETTIIDGEGAYRGVTLWNLKTTAGNRFVLDGFTVTNGFASQMGGGVLFYHPYRYEAWNGEVLNSIIVNNFVTYGTNAFPTITNVGKIGNGAYGGGICSFASYFTTEFIVSNSVVINNRAEHPNPSELKKSLAMGGGIYASTGGRKHVYNTRIEQNESFDGGGAYFANGGADTLIEKSVFAYNTANATFDSGGGGGGVRFNTEGVLVRNCLFHHNVSMSWGGGIAAIQKNGNVRIVNCTFAYNEAPSGFGGGIGVRYANTETGSGINLYNSIVYNNTMHNIYYGITGGTHTDAISKSTFTNNITTALQGSVPFPGSGNITVAPTFVDAGADDYHLLHSSRGLNEGFNLNATLMGSSDLNGNHRIDTVVGTVDIGCYEYAYRATILVIR